MKLLKRPTKNEYYLQIAEAVKTLSHDAETQFGVVFVRKDTGGIVATGYNGFIRGANDKALPNTRPDKYPFMVHAEENAICYCARHGVSLEKCIMYCRGSPCQHCTRLLWQCGVHEVIIREFHHTFSEVKAMKDIGVKIEKTKDGLFHLKYFTKK